MNYKKILGARIRELRKNKNLSQEKLAEIVCLEPPSICNIENGKHYPSMQNLEKIVNALGISFGDIFNMEHHKSNSELIEEINELMNRYPDKVPSIYKLIKALVL